MRPPRSRVFKIVPWLLLALCAAVVFVLMSGEPTVNGTCTVAFTGYTMDQSGSRLALFSISNAHSRSIGFITSTRQRTPTGWPADNDFGGVPPAYPAQPVVPPYTELAFPIHPPSNSAPWCVHVFYKVKPTLTARIRTPIARFLYPHQSWIPFLKIAPAPGWEQIISPEVVP